MVETNGDAAIQTNEHAVIQTNGHTAENTISDHVSSTSPDWSSEDPLFTMSPKVTPPESPSLSNGIRVPLNSPDPTTAPLTSPKYIPGSFTLAKLKLKSPEPSENDPEKKDPLSLRMRQDSEEQSGGRDRLLEVSLKSREPAQRRDLDHLIGLIAREMKKIKEESGAMPRYRCAGTRFSGRNIQFRFLDTTSMEFYKRTIKNDAGPTENHGGFYVRGAGDPPPFKKYRAWFPGEMMDCLDSVPDFLAIESKDKINENTIKIIGSSPSTSDGFMVYFEVAAKAETYITCFPAGIMCGAHKVKFCLVNDRTQRTPSSRQAPLRTTPSPSSSSDNWRVTSPASEPGMSADMFSKLGRESSLKRVEERKGHSRNGSEDRRNSAPEALQL